MSTGSINVCIHAGFLKEGASSYKRGGDGDLLFFTLWVRDDESGEEVPHKYRVERPELIREYTPLLTPGRGLTVHGKTRMIPVVRHGVTKFETLGLEVRQIVFHHRGGAAKAAGNEGEPASDTVRAPDAEGQAESPLARVMREEFSGAGVGAASASPSHPLALGTPEGTNAGMLS